MQRVLDWLSYPRGAVATLFGMVHTIVMSTLVIATAALGGGQRVLDFLIVWCWSMPLIWLSGARVEVRGGEHAAGGKKGFLILFNHSSLMDIPVLYAYIPRSFRFGAKIELFKIPFFGRAMKLCGVLPIDRSNRGKVMEVYKNAIERVNQGQAFALAPEGTRQKAATLGRFKRGPFEFALQAQMDILPVVLSGAYDVMPKNAVLMNAGKWRRKIVVQILPRVRTEGLGMERMDELLERVRTSMDDVYVQLNAELSGF